MGKNNRLLGGRNTLELLYIISVGNGRKIIGNSHPRQTGTQRKKEKGKKKL